MRPFLSKTNKITKFISFLYAGYIALISTEAEAIQ